ncbi:MAG: alginate lyase family protein [Dysgonomonas sp.]|nr:alginate lyase family protein [Dysgonomonas sp.]
MKKIYTLLFILTLISLQSSAQWLWNKEKLNDIKTSLNSLTYFNAYRNLIEEADQKLKEGNYSVTYKKTIPPSGDKHDYVSLSRYWWPNPDSADKLPYIYKDGESNPELDQYDRNRLGEMCEAVNVLALSYFYSNDEKYASKALELVRIWFLNEETKMNPNLNYSQFIPGRDGSKGRPEGLIDSYSFVGMLNSVQLLKQSRQYTQKDDKGLKEWFEAFAKWLQTSELGKKEDAATNNHATSYDSQLVTYYLFAENMAEVEKIVKAFPERRMFSQIEPDGKQPHELWRTLAYHYSLYNLSHMLDLFLTTQKLGKELYKLESEDGRSFYKAVDYLTSFLGKSVEAWPYKQISGWEAKQQELCMDLYRIYNLDPSQTKYLDLYKKYAIQDISDRHRLLYGAENTIEGMFSFASGQFDYAFQCVDNIWANTERKDLVAPRTINKDGSLHMINARDWCSGFFAGSLWFMYQYTKDNKWRKQADKFSMLIEGEKFDRTSHDVGFKMYDSFGNGYKLINSNEYKEVVIQSAKTLSERFNKKIGAIRSWDWNKNVWQYPVIIDNMMNLELLFEASKLSGDPTFYNIADAHAITTLKNHFRDDYSSYHVVDYSPETGKAIKKQTFQGYSDPSAWARGQAWGLYGYTMSYRYTKNPDFLAQAEGIANFIFTHPNLPADKIPYWDYNDPKIPNAPRDASSACIAASALYELASYSPQNKEKYIGWADEVLASLIKSYRTEPDTTQGFLLLHSTGHLPGNSEIDVPINYADYYFLEALLRRNNIK